MYIYSGINLGTVYQTFVDTMIPVDGSTCYIVVYVHNMRNSGSVVCAPDCQTSGPVCIYVLLKRRNADGPF